MNAKAKLHLANLTIWTDRIHNQVSNGLTIREWCSQNCLSIYAYNYWKHIHKESFVMSIIPDIVPLSALFQEHDTYLVLLPPSAYVPLYE